MSSILKALKKLEEEKAARSPSSIRIDSEILRSGDTPSPRYPYRKGTMLALLFFVCGSSLTYLWVKRSVHPTDSLLEQGAQQHASYPEEVVKKRSAEHGVVPDVSIEPFHSQANTGNSDASSAKQPVQASPAATVKQAAPVSTTTPVTGTASQPQATAALAPIKHIPAIRVDGIAFHFGSSDSLAVVNGTTVYAGAIVDGVKVEEIGKDKIRFSYEGEKFELPLGKSN